jgi:Zn-dependent protease
MLPTRQGSFRLFRLFGIDVYLHWLWFLAAVWWIQNTSDTALTLPWKIVVYLALFVIVTTHEFGHALACRSVGGRADLIVLWLFGGVAYVGPPQRPGAVLWSLAAGPLVNVVLVPVLGGLWILAGAAGLAQTAPAEYVALSWIQQINLGLLIFNILPIYPLDGGQILRALLWFPLGRARSLIVATIIGFIGVALLIILAVVTREWWLGLITVFIVSNCWRGWQQARALMRLAKMPRRDGFVCPSCRTSPPVGTLWVCGKCRTAFDTFETQGVCPKCGTQFAATKCLDCGAVNPISAWAMPPAIPITPSSGN